MQEEVNQKTVALSIRTTKLTGKVLAAALGKVARALQKHHRKALTPQGRQSVKKLMNHYGGKSAMPYVGAPKDFDRIAKEFHVDYAGVSYTSTMGTGGTNIAVFDETLFECESVHVVEINSIEYSYSNVN